MSTARVRRARLAGVLVAAAALVVTAVVIVVPRVGHSGSGPNAPPSAPLAAGIESVAHLGSAVELASKTSPLTSADPAAVAALASAEQAFTAALLKQVAPGTTDNVSVSPASLGIALAMLQNGARGRTQAEIAAALQAGTLSPSAVDEGWAGLTTQWSAAAKAAGIEFSSANSLWQQHGLALRAAFMATLARFYASGVWQVDFARDMPGALAAMNQWTSQHTHGKIAKLFGSLDPATLLVLANAVYFHASWQSPFDPTESKPAPFDLAGGSQVTATFMTSPAPVVTARTDTYDAAELPYQGGRFSALAIMPTHGSLTDFVQRLDGSQLDRIVSTLTTQLPVKLPRFTTTSTTDLGPVLKAMGMRTAFTDRADFSAMSPTPMQVGQAIQRVYLKVAEKGTEAAAATGIGIEPGLAQVPVDGITFDHPFLFLIRDTRTGAVLFASAINRPDAAS